MGGVRPHLRVLATGSWMWRISIFPRFPWESAISGDLLEAARIHFARAHLGWRRILGLGMPFLDVRKSIICARRRPSCRPDGPNGVYSREKSLFFLPSRGFGAVWSLPTVD